MGKFGEGRLEEKNPSPPVEENCTNVVTTMGEQSSTSSVGGANTLEEESLTYIQDTSKFHQGMPKFSSPIVSTNHMEDCIPLHVAHL